MGEGEGVEGVHTAVLLVNVTAGEIGKHETLEALHECLEFRAILPRSSGIENMQKWEVWQCASGIVRFEASDM